jgi:hypothetical protein
MQGFVNACEQLFLNTGQGAAEHIFFPLSLM